MIETKSHDYAWSKSWIEFKAPNASGVYWLPAKDGLSVRSGEFTSPSGGIKPPLRLGTREALRPRHLGPQSSHLPL